MGLCTCMVGASVQAGARIRCNNGGVLVATSESPNWGSAKAEVVFRIIDGGKVLYCILSIDKAPAGRLYVCWAPLKML